METKLHEPFSKQFSNETEVYSYYEELDAAKNFEYYYEQMAYFSTCKTSVDGSGNRQNRHTPICIDHTVRILTVWLRIGSLTPQWTPGCPGILQVGFQKKDHWPATWYTDSLYILMSTKEEFYRMYYCNVVQGVVINVLCMWYSSLSTFFLFFQLSFSIKIGCEQPCKVAEGCTKPGVCTQSPLA